MAYSKQSPFIGLKEMMESTFDGSSPPPETRIQYFPNTVVGLWSLMKVQTG